MRKRLVGAAILLIGAGSASNATAAPLGIKGSDTLERVAIDVLGACPAAIAASTTYIGGGSGGGESAMIVANYTQQIAPMSRQLQNAVVAPLSLCNLNVDSGCTFACVAADAGCTPGVAPTNGKRVACDANKGPQELLVGLDGIAVVAANHIAAGGGDSLEKTASAADDCGDAIVGGQFVLCELNVDAGCTTACVVGTDTGCGAAPANGKYVFADWRDVLAVVYGGQTRVSVTANAGTTVTECTTANTVVGAVPKPAYCPPASADPRYNPAAATHAVRNPGRIDCNGNVRKNLVNAEWNNLFVDGAGTPAAPLKCRNGSCPRGLKHAFRRGDLSGTTDTFVGLVGLIAIPGFTNTVANNFPTINAAATANAFCNAGEAPMNKGDSDYLDLDPVRRIADSEAAAFVPSRAGLEQVSEGFQNPSNPTGTRTDPAAGTLQDWAWSNFQNFAADTVAAGGIDPWRTGKQAPALQARKGLGVVLAVEIPTNFTLDSQAFWAPDGSPNGTAPTLCRITGDRTAPSLLGANVVCPDGLSSNLCTLPVDAAGTNFNCLQDQALPALAGIRDNRVYNLLVVNSAGKFVKDNYSNPNLTLPIATRQNRVVTGYFRLHTTRVTNLDSGVPTVASSTTGTCKNFDSTSQIGCLVRANPCSIGFAGREAVDAANTSMALLIGLNSNTAKASALPASRGKIENLVLGGTPYSIARPLWVNAYLGLANVTNIEICNAGNPPPTGAEANCTTLCTVGVDAGCTGTSPRNGKYVTGEKDILDCFGASGATTAVDDSVASHNFVKVPNRVCDQGVAADCAAACTVPTPTVPGDLGCTGVSPFNGKQLVNRKRTCAPVVVFPPT